jgi:hypothetical protein
LKDRITQVPQAKEEFKTSGYDQGYLESVEGSERQDYGGESQEDYEERVNDDEEQESYDAQKAHFNSTVQSLYNIKASGLKMPHFSAIAHQVVDLPDFDSPHKTKTIVFDLDETLIHCVDDA